MGQHVHPTHRGVRQVAHWVCLDGRPGTRCCTLAHAFGNENVDLSVVTKPAVLNSVA